MPKKPTIAELTEALRRERADAINIRRQYEDQIINLRNSVKTHVISELLPVIDNFERALKHVPKDLEHNDYVKGVNGVVRQFEKTLEDMGVHRIVTLDSQFNPHEHEAVSVEGNGQHEFVAEELQAGYRIGEDVIRHAKVKVKRSNK